ncbi:MAG: tryptophanase [Marinilabiliales bacterium]
MCMKLPYAEPYKIKMIETLKKSTRQERELWLKNAKYNLFNLRSDQVYIDLLTDSGTGAMSDKQWAALMLGDESYAGSLSYYKLKETIKDITGFEYFLPTHQGRAAENVLFSVMVKEGQLVPGNSHFDTTKGHIEFRKAIAVDCTVDEAFDLHSEYPFKGNIDIDKLEDVLKNNPRDKVAMIIVTVTCNTSGGQPVSMQNMKDVRAVADKYGVPVIYDSARYAENAYFIKQYESGYNDKTIPEIVKEMFSYADGMTMSSKKDGIVNIGGFIAMNDKELFRQASVYNIMFEGFVTYGGMAGRDMSALAQGLRESSDYNYLESRIEQVRYLGNKLKDYGITCQRPIGGHAVFIDALSFLPNVPREEYPAQLLATELYLEGGVRGVEIGTLLADRDPVTKKDRFPKLEFVRLTIPRRVYTNNHMDYVAACLKNIFDRKDSYKHGFRILYEAPIMRHFTVELEKI